MNAIQFLLEGEPAWFVGLLWLSLQAAILAGIVFVVIKLVGRWIPPAWRALLWFVVILRVLVPVSPPSAFSLQNLYVKAPAPAPEVRTAAPVVSVQSVNLAGPAEFVSEIAPVSEAVVQAPVLRSRILANLWLVGVGLCLVGLVVRYVMIRRHLGLRNSEVDLGVMEGLAGCRAKMGTRYPVRLAVSDRIAAPALTGLFPARLIVPTNFTEQNLTAEQVKHVLMHELAHLSQGHLILHWLSLMARALHWFNPALHFAAARLREECELAADAAALKGAAEEERRAYGETILKLLSQTVAPSSQLALGMAEQARHLEKRLRALASPPAKSFGVLGAIFLFALAAGGLTAADEKPAKVNSENGATLTNKGIDSGSKLQQAIALIKTGELRDALKLLEEVIQEDPTNPQATYVFNLFQEQLGSKPPGIIEPRYRKTVNLFSAMALTDMSFGPVRNTPEFQKLNQQEPAGSRHAGKAWENPRQTLFRKLETIRIDLFPIGKEIELIELLKELGSEIRKPNLQGRGPVVHDEVREPVNLLISHGSEGTDKFPNLEKYRVKFDRPVQDLTLREFLDRIVAVAKPPEGFPASTTLKYSVEDYAIVFSERTQATEQLITRTYRIDPKAFVLRNSSVREFLLTAAGVDFSTNAVSGQPGQPVTATKAMFYKDTLGLLYIRATLEDLDKVERVIHHLKTQEELSSPKLHTRTYKLDPKTFPSKVKGALVAANISVANQTTGQQIRAYFSAAGVRFGEPPAGDSPATPSADQKAMFYNEQSGVLFLRAPLEDLDLIEVALHALNREAAQMAFEVRVFEMPAEARLSLFDDLKATREVVTTNEYLFVLPKGEVGNEARVGDAKELVKKLGVPVNSMIATARSSEYIVTNERARQIEDGIGVLPGVEKLALPQLTTAVGRLSIISRQDTITMVTENAVVKDDRITDGTVRFEFGTMVWLKPELVTEQSMVFKVTFNFPQFLGYAKETEKPLPRMRIRSTEVSTEVRHGYTQVIVVPPHAAKAPMEDDRRYVIFLTPTVIDSTGMPVFQKGK